MVCDADYKKRNCSECDFAFNRCVSKTNLDFCIKCELKKLQIGS